MKKIMTDMRARRSWATLACAVSLLLAFPVMTEASSDSRDRRGKPAPRHKMSPGVRAMADAAQPGMVDVIVTFQSQPRAADDRRVRGLRGRIHRSARALPMRAMRIPADRLVELADDPNVKGISRDAVVEGMSASALETANFPGEPVDYSITSSGVGVAVIDSGVGFHVDQWPAVQAFDFVGNPSDPYSGPGDPFGHGSHVAGVISGDGYGSNGAIRGVAPYSDIISLRVLDSQGRGVVSDVIAALDWLLINASTYNVRVANLSLGKAVEESAETDPLVQAVEALWDAGIVVVCSAGNYGRDGNFTITSPGNSPSVITVGSITDAGTADTADDYVSTYSSQGPTGFDHYLKPDLVAPGNRFVASMSYEAGLRADLPDREVDCGMASCSGKYLELSGTSMAAAMVSGAVSMMIEQDPNLTPATVKARLMRSARKVAGDATAVGAGVLDIQAALAQTGEADSAPSPRMARSDEGPVLLIEDTAQLWGDTRWSNVYLWNDAYLWSDAYMWSDAYLWSDAYMWSDVYLWSDAYLWSDVYLWSDAYLWSDVYLWSDAVEDMTPLMDVSPQGLVLDDD